MSIDIAAVPTRPPADLRYRFRSHFLSSVAELWRSRELVTDRSQGVQLAAISYPHLSSDEIFHSMEVFYRRFYFRSAKIWEIVKEMLTNWEMLRRRLREGVEFMRFLRARNALSTTLASNIESTT